MDYTNLKEKMEKAINSYNERLSEIRAGRANPAILNKVKIDYYGTQTPINQVAAVSVPEARLIVIQPWDASVLKEIEKAILASDIGINPNNDGKVIRLTFPELTEERRKEIVKDVKKMAEEAKVAVRNVRREGIDKAKADQKAGDMTEDELKGAENEIQKLTDKYVEEIDKIAETKEKEEFNIGIQFIDGYFVENKLLLYYLQIHSNQLEYDAKRKFAKTITINLLDFNFFKADDYHQKLFIKTNPDSNGNREKLEMHVIELPKFNNKNLINMNRENAWMMYLCGNNEKLTSEIIKKYEKIKKLNNLLNKYWQGEVME